MNSGSDRTKYLKYAIGEITLVVIGILIALQINNWNEDRKNLAQEEFILIQLRSDIRSDIISINDEFENIDTGVENFIFCLEVLSNKREATLDEFLTRYGGVLRLVSFEQNTTTFDNLVSSGKIELIQNQALIDKVVSYYNTSYQGWDTAMQDYTRNIFAPYLMNFDHLPQMNYGLGTETDTVQNFYSADLNEFEVVPRSLEDYKNSVFIINTLRQKIFNMQGQKILYNDLLTIMEELDDEITRELEGI